MTGFSGELRENENLAMHTYYQIGGPAELLAIPKGINDLRYISQNLIPKYQRLLVLGKGSNTLIADEGFRGLVIKTTRMNSQIVEDGEKIHVGSSVAISSLLRKASERGWSGLEFLTGVPGSVGGAAWMNAGTHIGESKDALSSVEVFSLESGELRSCEGKDLNYSYRTNHFLKPLDIVWSTSWRFQKATPLDVKTTIDEMLARRKETQPVDFLSCGSVFKNPDRTGLKAWQVIEKVGLRGYMIGNAQFSEKHANFIVNRGGATATDVKALIDEAKSRAERELKVRLEEEVRMVGFE